ncbi:hypothetical protein LguiB_006781 [Lonicera macranthoides]
MDDEIGVDWCLKVHLVCGATFIEIFSKLCGILQKRRDTGGYGKYTCEIRRVYLWDTARILAGYGESFGGSSKKWRTGGVKTVVPIVAEPFRSLLGAREFNTRPEQVFLAEINLPRPSLVDLVI